MTAISIRKWVDEYEPMMEPRSDFIDRVRIVVDPIPSVGEQFCEFFSNLVRRHTDILFGRPIDAGPLPSSAEHTKMQVTHISFFEWIAKLEDSRIQRPTGCGKNILPLPFVQLFLRPQVRDKVGLLVGR
jgi:hypothetical protein